MKLLVLICFSLVVLFTKTVESSSVADEVCLEKQQAGVQLGTVFEVPGTCEKCACDGALRKFCMVDPICKKNKEAENRRPCYRGGSKFEHGGQVQVDCNICLCSNSTWDCTKQECNYGDARSGEEKVEDPSCKDLDNRCTNWVKRKGKEVCESKKYVQKKCIKSCDKCGAAEQETVVVEKPKKEVCKDKNENCGAWASRDGNLCGTHKFMIAKCRLTCGLCTKKGGVEDNEIDLVEEKEEEKEEEPREKTAEELEKERKEAEIAAWRNRLLEEGQLVDTSKTPLGCIFDCGGPVYPWGSSLQDSHCGVCECKREGKHNYFFKCTNSECETNPTCN